jgi:hypothetical protein
MRGVLGVAILLLGVALVACKSGTTAAPTSADASAATNAPATQVPTRVFDLASGDGTICVKLERDERRCLDFKHSAAEQDFASNAWRVGGAGVGSLPQASCVLNDNDIRCRAPAVCVAAENVEPPTIAVRTPAGATSLFVGGWQTLCVLDAAGAVHCSAPLGASGVCMARGGKHWRCGPETFEGQSAQPSLAGNGFDLCDAIARPLVRVPDLTRVASMKPYLHRAYVSQVDGRLFPTELEDGGCAEGADGSITCFEPNRCEKAKPWRAMAVTGLPVVRSWLLGADEGYATTEDGQLFSWPRRSESPNAKDKTCGAAPVARRVAIADSVRTVVAGYVPQAQKPGYVAAGCALTKQGSVWCWTTTAKNEPTRLTQVDFGPGQ